MSAPEWRIEPGLIDYPQALAAMEARVAAIRAGTAPELIWLVEHPPVYTAGTSADPAELVAPDRFPVVRVGRGGRYTYHGPGQRVGYVMLDLGRRGRDVRCFVDAIEQWVIDTLGDFGVAGRRIAGRTGVWTDDSGQPAKIAALGVRIRHWISFHGFSINVAPDLEHFGGIVPCGIADAGVTSLRALGVQAGMADVDAALERRLGSFLDRMAGSDCALTPPRGH